MKSVTAKAPKINKEATISVDLGTDCDDAVARFGKDVVFSNYEANVVIGIQAAIRRYLEKGKTVEEIQTIFNTFKPGVMLTREVDPLAAFARSMEGKSEEEMQKVFEELKAKIAAKSAGQPAEPTEE